MFLVIQSLTHNFFAMEKNVSTTTTIAEALLPNVMDT